MRKIKIFNSKYYLNFFSKNSIFFFFKDINLDKNFILEHKSIAATKFFKLSTYKRFFLRNDLNLALNGKLRILSFRKPEEFLSFFNECPTSFGFLIFFENRFLTPLYLKHILINGRTINITFIYILFCIKRFFFLQFYLHSSFNYNLRVLALNGNIKSSL